MTIRWGLEGVWSMDLSSRQYQLCSHTPMSHKLPRTHSHTPSVNRRNQHLHFTLFTTIPLDHDARMHCAPSYFDRTLRAANCRLSGLGLFPPSHQYIHILTAMYVPSTAMGCRMHWSCSPCPSVSCRWSLTGRALRLRAPLGPPFWSMACFPYQQVGPDFRLVSLSTSAYSWFRF